jgi:hypothetical protein
MDSSGSGQVPVAESCEHGIEPSGYMYKVDNFWNRSSTVNFSRRTSQSWLHCRRFPSVAVTHSVKRWYIILDRTIIRNCGIQTNVSEIWLHFMGNIWAGEKLVLGITLRDHFKSGNIVDTMLKTREVTEVIGTSTVTEDGKSVQ